MWRGGTEEIPHARAHMRTRKAAAAKGASNLRFTGHRDIVHVQEKKILYELLTHMVTFKRRAFRTKLTDNSRTEDEDNLLEKRESDEVTSSSTQLR